MNMWNKSNRYEKCSIWHGIEFHLKILFKLAACLFIYTAFVYICDTLLHPPNHACTSHQSLTPKQLNLFTFAMFNPSTHTYSVLFHLTPICLLAHGSPDLWWPHFYLPIVRIDHTVICVHHGTEAPAWARASTCPSPEQTWRGSQSILDVILLHLEPVCHSSARFTTVILTSHRS